MLAKYIYLRGTCFIKLCNYGVNMDKEGQYNYQAYYQYFNYKFLQPNNFDKNNTSIIRDKWINGSPVNNINKKGQETLKTAYGI